MTLVLQWLRILLMIIVGLLIGIAIAFALMPDNRLATWLQGDPHPAMRVTFEGDTLSKYARCHAAKCVYT
jgi:hypothetical protein